MSQAHCGIHGSNQLQPLSLVFVEYLKGDRFGELMAYVSLFPYTAITSIISVACVQRNLATVWLLLGCVVTEATNCILKRIIRFERPIAFAGYDKYHKYGMPSDHAQMSSYICVYLILILHTMFSNRQIDVSLRILRVPVYLSLYIISLFVAFSRMYLCYHSFAQILVGHVLGVPFAFFWFSLYDLKQVRLFRRWLVKRCKDLPLSLWIYDTYGEIDTKTT